MGQSSLEGTATKLVFFSNLMLPMYVGIKIKAFLTGQGHINRKSIVKGTNYLKGEHYSTVLHPNKEYKFLKKFFFLSD